MKIGFSNFLDCLNLYLDQQHTITDVNESKVNIYGSVILENGAIMCAINSFHGRPWFSNVSVRMNSEELFDYDTDQGGICYGQVNYLINCLSYKYKFNINLIIIF